MKKSSVFLGILQDDRARYVAQVISRPMFVLYMTMFPDDGEFGIYSTQRVRRVPLFGVDCDDLRRRYHALQRIFHPDMSRADEIQKDMLYVAEMIPEAYVTLRDPLRRASYYLREAGVSSVPLTDLKTTFELHEQIDAILTGGDEISRTSMIASLENQKTQLIDSLPRLFDTQELNSAAAAIERHMFLATLHARLQ